MRSPIPWFGGKGNMTAKLLPLMPQCKTYIEPFGGGASMLFARKPWGLEVYNDINHDLVAFFKVLADPELFKRFHRHVSVLPWSRQLYNEYRAGWKEEKDISIRAAKWFVVAKQSFAGRFGIGWSFNATVHTCSKKWLSIINNLPEVHSRMQRVQIECNSWELILRTYDNDDALFYCDPPYMHSTRSSARYDHEMTDADHEALVQHLLQLKGKVVLSGYDHEIYNPLTADGWNKIKFDVVSSTVLAKGKGDALDNHARTECVWIKPHDEMLF